MKANVFGKLRFITSSAAAASEENPILNVQPTRGNLKLNAAGCRFLGLEAGKLVDEGAKGIGHIRVLHAEGENGEQISFLCGDLTENRLDSFKLGPVTNVASVSMGGAMNFSSTNNWNLLGGTTKTNRFYKLETETAFVVKIDATGTPQMLEEFTVSPDGEILDSDGNVANPEGGVVCVQITFKSEKAKSHRGRNSSSTSEDGPDTDDDFDGDEEEASDEEWDSEDLEDEIEDVL